MALRAIDLDTLDAPPSAGWPLATVTTLPRALPTSRAAGLAAMRRERRRWAAIGTVVFSIPFAACLAVLEVVR